ncbi:MAG TPA: DUF4232 domain-containing protein [Actinocrinis sp.]|uniref:DUF4232 domain-containing protein n=1 Tax=Actinocrinis sp. TaxID=1920516 RepID=UPI002DDD5094|nr:DUF4232 domain-containing protein [Actinocrinis sp.]HEV2342850.1 DUF4232 domain-containing protein [Actinocrinis sp.]
MNRVFLAESRRAVGALSLLACVTALSAACTSNGASGPVPTAVGGSGPSAGAGGGGATNSASATDTSAAGSGGSGGIGGSGGSGDTSSPAASAHAAGSNTCLVRYLNGATGLSQGAMGTTYVNIVFKNLNNEPCTLYGYPGVSFGAGTPVNQVGQPAGRDHSVASKVITLQPGGYAYATLRITDALNYPTASCSPTPTTYLLVYPPNTSNLLYVPYNTNACSADVVTMTIQAVQAGNGGG